MKKCNTESDTSPSVDQEVVNDYLDNLRSSGAINMFGAASYLERKFGLSAEEAQSRLLSWMESFQD